LQKIIQADDGGHDSKEDAVACMQLMLYKVKSDVRRKF
jgi:RNA exonuclease 1